MAIFKSSLKRIENLFGNRLTENLVFFHIPKCGGSSVSYAIHWRYLTLDVRKDRYLVSLDPAASSNVIRLTQKTDYPDETASDYPILKFREELLLYLMSQKDIKYIAGHFVFCEAGYQEFGHKYAFITILRDPVKRWISSYFYNRYKKSDHEKVEVDIAAYLQSEFGRSQGYEYIKFLGGADKTGDYTSKSAIDRAKNNLHKFDVIGCLEYQEEFLRQFQNRFGVSLKLEERNRNPKSKSFQKSIITAEIEEKIKMICKPDIELYQYAIDNFVKVRN